MILWYRLALICGAAPLIAGIAIFVTWVYTRWNWLVGAGLLVINVGIVLFIVGVVCLMRFNNVAREEEPIPRRRTRRSWTAVCLLLGNFPVAAGIVLAVP